MGRPYKCGLDYYPMDVTWLNDKKLVGLINRQGSLAALVYQAILCRIYETDGYYAVWDEDNLLAVSRMAWCDQDYVDDVVTACLEKGLFDMRIYMIHGILTSAGVQRRYLKAIKERIRKMKQPDVQLNLRRTLWLLSEKETRALKIEMDLTEGNTTAVTQERGTEEEGLFPEKPSKVKERKEEESIQENRSVRAEYAHVPAVIAPAADASATPESALPSTQTNWRFKLSIDERAALEAVYGKEAVEAKILRLQDWAGEKGFWIKYPMDRLRAWLADDELKEKKRREEAERAADKPPAFKKTGAHAYSQRQYTDEELDALLCTDLEHLND